MRQIQIFFDVRTKINGYAFTDNYVAKELNMTRALVEITYVSDHGGATYANIYNSGTDELLGQVHTILITPLLVNLIYIIRIIGFIWHLETLSLLFGLA